MVFGEVSAFGINCKTFGIIVQTASPFFTGLLLEKTPFGMKCQIFEMCVKAQSSFSPHLCGIELFDLST